jgi:NAD(P)-dependent dehydrogenase (short-subunit alcohol dehydrogenase family)
MANEEQRSTNAQIETSYFGTLAMCRAFAPVLAANGGGALLNVLSGGQLVHQSGNVLWRLQGRGVGAD